MKKHIYILFFIGIVMFMPTMSFASEARLYTLTGFLELLTEKGLIASEKLSLAQELIEILDTRVSFEIKSNDVSVNASQRIEYSDRTFNRLEDIQGLVLIIENTSDNTIQLHTNYTCPVTYEIYDGEEKVFDSSTLAHCLNDKQVTYTLDGNDSRMFEIVHKRDDYSLSKGEYRFVLEHENYGTDEIEITVE